MFDTKSNQNRDVYTIITVFLTGFVLGKLYLLSLSIIFSHYFIITKREEPR